MLPPNSSITFRLRLRAGGDIPWAHGASQEGPRCMVARQARPHHGGHALLASHFLGTGFLTLGVYLAYGGKAGLQVLAPSQRPPHPQEDQPLSCTHLVHRALAFETGSEIRVVGEEQEVGERERELSLVPQPGPPSAHTAEQEAGLCPGVLLSTCHPPGAILIPPHTFFFF